MTHDQEKAYFDHPDECPFCHGDEIEIQRSVHEQRNDVGHCNDCFKVWYLIHGSGHTDIAEANWMWAPGQTEPEPQ